MCIVSVVCCTYVLLRMHCLICMYVSCIAYVRGKYCVCMCVKHCDVGVYVVCSCLVVMCLVCMCKVMIFMCLMYWLCCVVWFTFCSVIMIRYVLAMCESCVYVCVLSMLYVVVMLVFMSCNVYARGMYCLFVFMCSV